MTTPPTTKLTLKKVKDCKHSVVFEASDKDAIIDRVYIRRPWSDHIGTVTLTVEAQTRPEAAVV